MGRSLAGTGPPYVDSPIVSGVPLISTASEALYAGGGLTGLGHLPPDEPKAGRVFCLRLGGIWSTGASGTLTLSPILSNGSANVGASQVATVPINMTNVPWTLWLDLVIRTVHRDGGFNSQVLGSHGFFITTPAASAPAAGQACVIPLAGTVATTTVDLGTSLLVNKTLTVAGAMVLQYGYSFWRN